jgi:putative membrane protein
MRANPDIPAEPLAYSSLMTEELRMKEPESALDEPSVALASHRTAMSFERTVMSCDSTLMSVMRTALSLIGFGFTIFTFFHTLNDKFLDTPLPAEAPRRFGGALIALGVILLSTGIWYHIREWRALWSRRQALFAEGLVRHAEIGRQSSALSVAFLLLAVGLLALLSVAVRVGPF